jgi:pimeloyl-ACP methyl ester carboxylesterase
MTTSAWRPSHSYTSSGGRVSYEVAGQGPAVVLVHGTPSWSYLWRNVVTLLADRFTVYVHDLLGYGTSEQREGQDVSIPAQAAVLTELMENEWGLEDPCIVGHDIGGAIALRLALSGRPFRRVALCDAVAIAPWITPFSRHVQKHMEAFRTVPEHIHRHMITAHLKTAMTRPMGADDLEPYLAPWLGAEGQAAYYRQVAQFEEAHTRDIEPFYEELQVPTLVLWGERDGWLDLEVGARLAATIPAARMEVVPGAGHFAPEDQPEVVARLVADFFAKAT